MRGVDASPRTLPGVSRRCGGLAVAAILLLVGCSPLGSSGAPLPGSAPIVTVTMDEYRVDVPRSLPAGRVVFRIVNAGDEAHEPEFVPLPEDMPPINEQLQGDQRAAIAPFAGIPPVEPGETGTFAVDLVPNVRYAFICFARTADGQLHARLGESAEFRAGQPAQ